MPKDPALVQRRNRVTTRATLPTVEQSAERDVPELPPIGRAQWHPMVLGWWEAIWRSPMAAEYLDADKQALYMLAKLHQDFYKSREPLERQKIAAEIRQQGVRFGLSPIDRRRLQWEVEKGEQASDRTARRRQTKEAGAKDPREALKVV